MISEILRDLYEIPICLTSRRGWGKSSTLKHIIGELKRSDPEVVIKIFDSSLSWFFRAPVKYRQLVNTEKILNDQVENIGSCVFYLRLGREGKRAFIASIIQDDMTERINLALEYGEDILKGLPLSVYVFEEANLILNSRSLMREDQSSEVLNSFISEGRNLGLGAFFVTTRLKELSTAIRERSALLIGKVLGESDLRAIRNVSSLHVRDLVKSLRKYQFVYNGEVGRFPDSCKNIPRNYTVRKRTVIHEEEIETPTIQPVKVGITQAVDNFLGLFKVAFSLALMVPVLSVLGLVIQLLLF